ncbi:hypothetical protein, partial [Thiolapillus sp.]|uniref:hypothetical protein n=1 Tax=Thiolapillus sp. TaxID=2017437 RepID=UPI003AF5494B
NPAGQTLPALSPALQKTLNGFGLVFRVSPDTQIFRLRLALGSEQRLAVQACRYLVIDFGTSKSPKSTRQRDNHYCPGRPASVPLRQHPRTLDAGFAALPQMTGRDFSYAYFVFPLRYRTPDKQCGPGRYRGLTAFASLSMAVSV